MKIKAYLYLPETSTAFEGLCNNPDLYNEIIKELYVIKHKLKNFRYELFYDSNNVSNFLDVANDIIPHPYLGGIRNQLQTIISTKSRDINTPHHRNPHSVYAKWSFKLDITNAPSVISESAECVQNAAEVDIPICICLGNSLEIQKDDLNLIKDNLVDDLPPVVITIPAVKNDIGFVRWITTLSTGIFALRNNAKFEPLDKRWKKERIYKEKASGYYWYFDFFHKDNRIHYEVFDTQGLHLSEADINGNFIPNSKDINKSIRDIIN